MQTFERAGLHLAYDDHGARPGRPAAVLVHGWCSGRADLRALGEALVTTYRVIALDLPGHGDSQVPADTAERLSVAAMADDVAALCDALQVRAAVLIGHSSGAAVAIELAARRPETACAVVALDPPILLRKEVLAGVEPLHAALHTPHWREAMREFASGSYLPTDDPTLLETELATLDRMVQDVVAAVPEQVLRWDADAALAAIGAPLLHVDASQMSDLDRLSDLVPTVALARTTGVGHMQLVAHPAQAIAAIEGFLTATTGRRPVDNRSPVLALFAALKADQLERIDELVSADFVDHGAPPGMVEPGPAGYRTVLGLLRTALDLRWEPLGVAAQGETVMVWVRNHGRHVGEFLGMAPTGTEFTFEAMHCFRVQDGIVREHHAVRDDAALFRALGGAPT